MVGRSRLIFPQRQNFRRTKLSTTEHRVPQGVWYFITSQEVIVIHDLFFNDNHVRFRSSVLSRSASRFSGQVGGYDSK